MVAEAIFGALADVLYRYRRGICRDDNFSLTVLMPQSLRTLHAIFWPGPSVADIGGCVGVRQYARDRFPPDLFPPEFFVIVSACVCLLFSFFLFFLAPSSFSLLLLALHARA